MRRSGAGALRGVLLTSALVLGVLARDGASAEEPAPAKVLDWETGAGKSYYIPAFEILGFNFALNVSLVWPHRPEKLHRKWRDDFRSVTF